MPDVEEDKARQGERQKLMSHVLVPSFALAGIALLVVLLIYVV